jgi:hypothetical protein
MSHETNSTLAWVRTVAARWRLDVQSLCLYITSHSNKQPFQQTPPPAAGADTTWSPVEFDQELRGNVIRMQTRPRRPWGEIFFSTPETAMIFFFDDSHCLRFF